MKLTKFIIGISLLLLLGYLISTVPFPEEDARVRLCDEAGKLGEEAWRDCVAYYINAGFTMDEIIGKTPLPSKSK